MASERLHSSLDVAWLLAKNRFPLLRAMLWFGQEFARVVHQGLKPGTSLWRQLNNKRYRVVTQSDPDAISRSIRSRIHLGAFPSTAIYRRARRRGTPHLGHDEQFIGYRAKLD
jgi:hypothetical protein